MSSARTIGRVIARVNCDDTQASRSPSDRFLRGEPACRSGRSEQPLNIRRGRYCVKSFGRQSNGDAASSISRSYCIRT
jgi:hypothetical protein